MEAAPIAKKGKKPHEFPEDTLVHEVWWFRTCKDVNIQLFGFPDCMPPNLAATIPRQVFRTNSAVQEHALECRRLENIDFSTVVFPAEYAALAQVIALQLLKFRRNYIGISKSLKWRMRYCDGHGSMVSHETRGYEQMTALTLGSGLTIKAWEKALISIGQASALADRLSNAEAYTPGPISDKDLAWLYIVSAWHRG